MYKKKAFFVTFEGIEGSGKSYQSKKLFKSLKKKGYPVILTREPGGTKSAEKIRELILEDYFSFGKSEKFNEYTDTLLYLAARNEHVKNVLKPAILKKKIILCDRYIDSTLAYQVYGKRVSKKLVDSVHKHILENIKPNLTILLKANINKISNRLKKRKKKNRYDKFSKHFYKNVQKAFIKIANKDKKKYFIVDNSKDLKITEEIILNKILNVIKK